MAMSLNRNRPILSVVMCAAAVVSIGCASAVHGTRQRVSVVTEPAGAVARFGFESITTPGELQLPRKPKTVTVTIEKEGYEPVEVVLRRKVSGAVWLNLLAIPVGAAVSSQLSDDDGMFDRGDNAGIGALLLTPIAFAGVAGDFILGGAYRRDRNAIEITLSPRHTPSTAVQEPNPNLTRLLLPPVLLTPKDE
jgi:hypothetical protein